LPNNVYSTATLTTKANSMGSIENISESEIKEQLDRILTSPAFKNSRVLSEFLKFIINETLAGRGTEIKEYTIGLQVLDRNKDFNPQLDSIVRIHAGRLRRTLNEYYYEKGINDPIRIEIPKGSYHPIFLPAVSLTDSKNTQTVTKETMMSPAKKPVVAVIPFRNISRNSSRDFFADGLGEQLSTELTWFHNLTVISYYSSRYVAGLTGDIKESARLLGAQYLLSGSVQSDEKHLRIRVQLIQGLNAEQLWAQSFEHNNTVSGLFEIQNEIVRSILTTIGGYYGAIFRDVFKPDRHIGGNETEIHDAIFWYYHYQKVTSSEVLEKTICALENTVKADPDYALAWAMLGELYLDEKSYQFKKLDNPAEKGLQCALHAVNIDPTCQHGYMALAWIYLFHHNLEECLKSVDQCLSINPNASDMTGGLGFVLICAGEFDRGFKLLQEAVKCNPYYPWWYHAAFVCYYLVKKKYREAWHWAEKIDAPDVHWNPLMKASVLGHLNRIEEAGKNIQLLLKLIPDAGTRVPDILESFLLSPELNKEILEGLKKAGLEIVEGRKVL
jgi:TolB-like protein